MHQLTIRGLPSSIANSDWWLADLPQSNAADGTDATPDRPAETASISRRGIALLILLSLIFLADLLFWKQSAGVSLVIFSAALCAAALFSIRPGLHTHQWITSGCLWCLCAFPVIEYVQFTSVSFLAIGHLALLIWAATRSRGMGLLKNLLLAPMTLLKIAAHQLTNGTHAIRHSGELIPKQATLMNWILPTIASAWFLILFFGANPIFEKWADEALAVKLSPDSLQRLGFWLMIALIAVPFIWFRQFEKRASTSSLPKLESPEGIDAILNAPAIANSLFVFNILFLLQNATDFTFLWAGAELPDGVTFADYAQSGAYPLLATSVLAGVFVLVSRQFAQASSVIRALLLLWIAQNLFLVASTLGRLELYVDAYGLSYLRVRAGIGMWIVAAGMLLLGLQLWRNWTNIRTTCLFSGLCGANLYLSCFVNFANVIAAENLSRPADRIDDYYLCEYLGDGVEAIRDYAQLTGQTFCRYEQIRLSRKSDDWRGWTLRTARLAATRQSYIEQFRGSP